MNTAPRVEHTGKGKPPEPVTRAEALRGQGREPVLPINPAPFLTDWLLEIGPSVPGGAGAAAIGFSEMAAWSRLMGINLTPWEGRTLRRLSRAFVNQQSDAHNPSCIEPIVKVDQEVARSRVDAQFAAMFAALKGKSEGSSGT